MEILVKENKAQLKGLPFDFEEHAKILRTGSELSDFKCEPGQSIWIKISS